MSEAVATQMQDTEPAERRVCRRTFAAEITAGDGRTVDVRIVPYGEVISHNDGLGGVPKGVEYREQIMPGWIGHQVNAANRVLANFEHQPGISGVVGHGVALREQADGTYGSFRIHESPDGDKTLTLIREGVLDGVSFEARFVKSVKAASGVVQRVRANLFAVAFTRFAAYSGAKVLGLREEDDGEPEQFVDAMFLPVDMDPELVRRLRAQGVSLPGRYQTHPDSGTPESSGTPDGTRQPTEDDYESLED